MGLVGVVARAHIVVVRIRAEAIGVLLEKAVPKCDLEAG